MAAIGMTSVTLIALGGAAGSVLRYLTSVLAIELLRLAVLAITKFASIPGKMDGLSPTPWLAVLLLFVLSGVFTHGARMRTDLEGTI